MDDVAAGVVNDKALEMPAPNTDGAVDAGVVEAAAAGAPNGDEVTVADPKMDLGAGAVDAADAAVDEGVEDWPKMEEAAPKAGTAAAGSPEAEVETGAAVPKMEPEESPPPPPPKTVVVTGAADETAVAEAAAAAAAAVGVVAAVEEAPNKFKEADLEGD